MKHHVTPNGYASMLNELRELGEVERPQLVETVSWAASNGDRSENGDYIYGKKRLREIDRRIRYLKKQVESAIVVDPKTQQHLTQVYFGATVTLTQVYFGATVTYENQDTEEKKTIKIVGKDEALQEKSTISYHSPVAKALFKSQVGDEVVVHTPSGEHHLLILEVRYVIS